MSGAPFQADVKISVLLSSQSPIRFSFGLFCALPGASDWTPVAHSAGTNDTPEQEFGPYPGGTRLGFNILIGGDANMQWVTKLRVSQAGQELACSPAPYTGTLDADGLGYLENKITLS